MLHGAFQPGTTMRMTVAAGLESVLGGRTESAYEADVYIGSIPPTFRFLSETGVYMLLGGERKLEVRTINVPKLNVRISQVFQNNLVYFLHNGRYYDYDYWGGEDEESASPPRKYRYELGNYGRVLKSDSITVGGQEKPLMKWLRLRLATR